MNNQPAAEQPQPLDSQTSATLHMRAGQSSDELRKTLLTLSVGAAGFYFVMLTGDRVPVLSILAWIVVDLALLGFALAILFGLLAWHYAGRDFYEKAERGAGYKGSDHGSKVRYDNYLWYSFSFGVLFSFIYFIIRVAAG